MFGRALVVPAGAAAGSVLADADLAEAEVDLAEEFAPAVIDPLLAVGRTLAQNLKAGQTLRQTHIKSRQWFVAGETVRVVATGEGSRSRARPRRSATASKVSRRECAPKAGAS